MVSSSEWLIPELYFQNCDKKIESQNSMHRAGAELSWQMFNISRAEKSHLV